MSDASYVDKTRDDVVKVLVEAIAPVGGITRDQAELAALAVLEAITTRLGVSEYDLLRVINCDVTLCDGYCHEFCG